LCLDLGGAGIDQFDFPRNKFAILNASPKAFEAGTVAGFSVLNKNPMKIKPGGIGRI
jgi:hypothetical protein